MPLRVIPDISLDADPGTGFLIGLTQAFPNGAVQYSETRYGGTSLASPLLAGLVADADQVGGVSLGLLNPLLYSMDSSDPSSIEDVVPSPTPVGNFRTDYAGAVGEGLNNGVTYAEGTVDSFRELYYGGLGEVLRRLTLATVSPVRRPSPPHPATTASRGSERRGRTSSAPWRRSAVSRNR